MYPVQLVSAAALVSWALIAAQVDVPRTVQVPSTAETASSVAAIVQHEYFDASVAARVADALRARLAAGRYAEAKSPDALAALLTADLRALTSDQHLAVTVVAPEPPGARSPAAADVRALEGRRSNFGVQRAEVLPGNLGYLSLTSFYRLDEMRPAIEAAMSFLQHADALLLDLRANGGGSPDSVALVASYLVPPSAQPLFEIVPRTGASRSYAVMPIPGQGRDTTRPVYVLTAHSTFSAGEGLAFLLQAKHRAEIVGERTAGAANPGRPYPVNASFEVVVPNGRVRVAGLDRNWEGTGAVPDVPVPAEDALRTAQARAIRRLVAAATPGAWRETLIRRLGELGGAP